MKISEMRTEIPCIDCQSFNRLFTHCGKDSERCFIVSRGFLLLHWTSDEKYNTFKRGYIECE